MAEYAESETEKRRLHEAYKREIEEVRDAFDEKWNEFNYSWRKRLAHNIPIAEVTEIPELPENHYTAVEVKLGDDDTERWFFFTDDKPKYNGLVKEGWWRDNETWNKRYRMECDDEDYRRVQLYHYFNKQSKKQTLSSEKLRLELAQGSCNPPDHISNFKGSFQKKYGELMRESFDSKTYPRYATKVSNKGTAVEIERDIPLETHDTFFEAYISALSDIFIELVTERRQLIVDAEENMKRARETA